MTGPKIFLKIGSQDEFEMTERISGLTYLGLADDGSSPQFTNNYQDISGIDGSPFVNQVFAKRTFNEQFSLHFETYEEFVLAKHEIYQLFGMREPVRVRTDTSPGKVYFGYVTPFNIAPYKLGAWDANFTIPFDVPKGYRYSMYRSDSPNLFKQEGWQFGMNLPNSQPSYHFTTTSFRIWNASDIRIDPYYQKHDLKIYINFSGKSLKITNKTNNSEWQYNESINDNDKVVLDGITTFLNGNNVSGKTDYGDISLDPGWNEIECTGASSVDIQFSFPFIYLS